MHRSIVNVGSNNFANPNGIEYIIIYIYILYTDLTAEVGKLINEIKLVDH